MIHFTVNLGAKPLTAEYQECLDKLHSVYQDLRVVTKRPDWFDPTDDYRYDADVTRFNKLCEPGEWHYIDIDSVVERHFDFADMSKPWFANGGSGTVVGQCGIPDIWNIVSRDHNFMRWLLNEEQRTNKNRKFGTFQALLFDNRDKINFIPGGYYRHENLSLSKGVKNG